MIIFLIFLNYFITYILMKRRIKELKELFTRAVIMGIQPALNIILLRCLKTENVILEIIKITLTFGYVYIMFFKALPELIISIKAILNKKENEEKIKLVKMSKLERIKREMRKFETKGINE